MRVLWLPFFFAALAAHAQDAHVGHGAAPRELRTETAPDGGHGAHGMPEGYSEVALPSDRVQLLGVKLARAQRGPLTTTIRAPATLTTDETREAHIHTKLMGWVEELHVNAVGQRVKKDDPLYSLYSQELFAAQQEFARARTYSPDLAVAAKTRLRLWDVPEDQLRLIEQKGPRRTIVFRSPIAGTVIEKSVLKGHAVDESAMLYRIADLSVLWVQVDVYEYEVQRLDKDGVARILVQGLTRPYEARVDYVYPTVDPVTRTIKVRLLLPNPTGELRPGNFATAELPSRPVDVLWVPDEAIIDTGVRQVVYVVVGEGRFRPLEVRVGRRADGRAEILSALSEGQQVVVSSQFLIDSESRLRGASTSGQPAHGGH